jgi:hypothetical protein
MLSIPSKRNKAEGICQMISIKDWNLKTTKTKWKSQNIIYRLKRIRMKMLHL